MKFCQSIVIIFITATNLRQTTSCDKIRHRWSQYAVCQWLQHDKNIACESSRGYLASLTTAEELNAVLDYMVKKYNYGKYVIGLSRQAGLNRSVDENWKWETGEVFNSSYIPWVPSQPNENSKNSAGIRIDITSGKILDHPPTTYFGAKGYICEYDHLYFQSVKNRGVTMDALVMRCALRCQRHAECQGFHIDDAGCQIEEEMNDDAKRHYDKIICSN
ncbi:uncharacterized protein LOC117114689 [Anneissia japonica]|uniref:uncharacterized protein LOC117114689 n=1 Tax=Anneissia japonica TaxID=1529436 RepID=UPI0014259274|nr:uncharacterized protein LOC117114689 [Anneissia japonica]